MGVNYSEIPKLTVLSYNGEEIRRIILENDEIFALFAKTLGAVCEISLFLTKFEDRELDRAFYGKEIRIEYVGVHEKITYIEKANDGAEKEFAVPWGKTKLCTKSNFKTPVEKLFQKVLDIVVRSFVETSLKINDIEGFSLLTVPFYPTIATIEDALRLAAEIEEFNKNYLIISK